MHEDIFYQKVLRFAFTLIEFFIRQKNFQGHLFLLHKKYIFLFVLFNFFYIFSYIFTKGIIIFAYFENIFKHFQQIIFMHFRFSSLLCINDHLGSFKYPNTVHNNDMFRFNTAAQDVLHTKNGIKRMKYRLLCNAQMHRNAVKLKHNSCTRTHTHTYSHMREYVREQLSAKKRSVH